MNSKPSYQLTSYPSGSLRELWAISWPLMLSFLSISLMMFADRLMLSHYSVDALNASAHAGVAVFAFLVPGIAIAAISEVFVGRANGKGALEEAGQPVWQLIWFSLLMTPLFIGLAFLAAPFLFFKTGNEILEKQFFTTLLFFAPLICSTVALTGFFIGTGQVKTVTKCTFLANFVNICLDTIFIFGWGPFPAMGIVGAAIATGLAQTFQVIYLFRLFLSARHREIFGTGKWHFSKTCFIESLRIGVPGALNLLMELCAHLVFLRLMIFVGGFALTITAFAQSIIFLLNFLTEGLAKAVTTIVANLIGANHFSTIGKVMRSASYLQCIFFLFVFCILFFFPEPVMHMFFSERDTYLLHDPTFISSAKLICIWVCLFFLFDGLSRICIGQLTAAGDTKFVFYLGLISNWFFYIIPVSLFMIFWNGSSDQGWFIAFIYSFINFVLYGWRYRSKKWMASNLSTTLALETS